MNTQPRYVVGFLLDNALREVVLIRKVKPAWMAGKFNGPGGKIEEGETPEAAMQREFHEECGFVFPQKDWHHFATLRDLNGHAIDFLYCVAPWPSLESLANVFKKFEESASGDPSVEYPVVRSVLLLHSEDVLPNVAWLVRLATTIIIGRESVSRFTIVEETPNTIRQNPPRDLETFRGGRVEWPPEAGQSYDIKSAFPQEMMAPSPSRCLARESGGVQCELPAGHEGEHACPEALRSFNERHREDAISYHVFNASDLVPGTEGLLIVPGIDDDEG